jgi:pimeloyl-ACP methyl ester carboxylesterase
MKGIASTTDREAMSGGRKKMSEDTQWRPVTIARHSYFWVGVEFETTEQGTVSTGDHMLCEYIIPETVKFKYPIVLVHGGGQSIVYHGLMEQPGWVNRLLHRGFMVYIIERPGHGRTGYRPDVFGPVPPPTPLEVYTGDDGLLAATVKAGSQWPGTGLIDDEATRQWMGQVGGAPSPVGRQSEELCRRRGVQLLEKIGPSVLLAASAGSIFSWIVADARPDLVKGIMSVEGMPPAALQTPLTTIRQYRTWRSCGLTPSSVSPGTWSSASIQGFNLSRRVDCRDWPRCRSPMPIPMKSSTQGSWKWSPRPQIIFGRLAARSI